jgi:hypothetical protein
MGKKTKKQVDSDISSDAPDDVQEPIGDAHSSGENDSDENQTDNNDIPDTNILKEKVAGYLKIDDMIREKKEEIKELTEKKLKYEEFIKNYLEKANKSKIETKDGDIVFKKQTSKAPLKEEMLEKAIVKKFQDTKKITDSGVKIAHDILEEVNNMRGVSIKNNIRRMKKREPKKK